MATKAAKKNPTKKEEPKAFPPANEEQQPLLQRRPNNQIPAANAAPVQPARKQQSKQKDSFVVEQLNTFWHKYSEETPQRIKLIDSFLLFLFSLIVWQLFYRIVAGTDFPKNAFLSGMLGPLGVMVMTVALRMQIAPNKEDRPNKVSGNRALWEYLFGVLVLFVVIINFLG